MHAHRDDWSRSVEAACARKGLHMTPLRQSVLAILTESPAPLGAYAIIESLSRREGKTIAPPTVYRTLDFFLEHGFLHKIESRNTYARCEHFDHAHQSVLLLCEKCGRSEEIEAPQAMFEIAATAERAGFALGHVMVEAQGLCRRCAEAA